MKKIIIIIVILVLLGIGTWFLMGGKKEAPSGGGTATPGPGGQEESLLTEILGKVGNITFLKYDMVTTMPGQAAITTKIWLKGQSTRMETTSGGQSIVYLVNAAEQQAYLYTPSNNTAMKANFNTAQEIVGEPLTQQSESLEDYSPVVVGSEVLDGKDCLIVEYTAGTTETKAWIWKDYGLAIKMESITPEGISTVELKNIELGNIADSVFELPAGVQIMEVPSGY